MIYRVPLERLAHFSSPRMMRLACDMCDEVWVRSCWEETAIKATGTSTKISKINLSVPETLIQHSIQETKRDIDFLFVGHFDDPRKNIKNLISAVQELGSKLTIVGSGNVNFLNKKKASKNWNSSYEILGRVSDEELRTIYQRTKVVCLPSLYEGVGLSAMEGLANGAKIIITSVGGTTDYFSQHVVYVDKPKSIAHIKRALETVQESTRLDDTLRLEFLSKFSEKTLAEKFSQSRFFD